MTNPIYTSEKVCSYVYYGEHKISGEFYSGSRTTKYQKLPSHLDLPSYRTSSKKVKEMGFDNFNWIIVAEFFTDTHSDDAYWFEQNLIKENWNNPLKLNSRYQDRGNGKPKFSTTSKTKGSDKGRLSQSEKISILNPTYRTLVVKMREEDKMTFREIHYHLTNNLNIKISYDTVIKLYKRESKQNNLSIIKRTKENNPGFLAISKKLTGRTTKNNTIVAKQTERKTLLKPNQRALLIELKNLGMSLKEIHQYFIEILKVKITLPTLRNTYNREIVKIRS